MKYAVIKGEWLRQHRGGCAFIPSSVKLFDIEKEAWDYIATQQQDWYVVKVEA